MGKYYRCDVSFLFNFDKEKCNHCMECVNNCPYNALHFENDEFTIDSERCSRCESCLGVCPEEAIDVKYIYKPKEIQAIHTTKNNNGSDYNNKRI